jgi:DNA-binding NarL/FixJ family response regulator
MGDRKSIAIVCNWIGYVAMCFGDFEGAKTLLQEALQIAPEVNYPVIQHWALEKLGTIACFEGYYEVGHQMLIGLPTPKLPRFGDFVAACGLDDFELVREKLGLVLHKGLATFAELQVEHEPLKVFPMAAMLLAHEGELVQAVEYLARQSSEHEILMGYFDRWELLAEVRSNLESQLGATAFDAAWQRGEKLSVETLVSRLLTYLGEGSDRIPTEANDQLNDPLTPRELEVLALVGLGRSNRQIAEELVISVNTVKRYVYDICQKLDAQNRTHAVTYAREIGLL